MSRQSLLASTEQLAIAIRGNAAARAAYTATLLGEAGVAVLSLTFWRDTACSVGAFEALSFQDVISRVMAVSAASKSALPSFSAARFGDTRSAAGSLRHGANLLECTAVVGDHDAEAMAPCEAANRLRRGGVRGVIYSTPSSRPDTPRWRVVVPLARPCGANAYRRHVDALDAALGGGVLARESWVPVQYWYLGSIDGRPSPEVHSIATGAAIDEVGPSAFDADDDGDDDLANALPATRVSRLGLAAPIEVVASALDAIPNDRGPDWERWNHRLMAIFSATGGHEEGREIARAWSTKSAAHDDAVFDVRWDHLHRSPPTQIGAGTLLHEATQYGWRDPRKDEPTDTFGDVSNARRLARVLMADGIIHVEGKGWHQRGSAAFYPIAKSKIIQRAQAVADEIVRATATAISEARDVDAARRDHAEALKVHRFKARIVAMVDLAAAAEGVAALPEEFDTSPNVIATPGGVWVLTEGRMRAPLPGDRFLRSTSIAPQSKPLLLHRDAPTFARFLREFTSGDADVGAFLASWFGYALSGSAREHKALFLVGPGGNGKGVLLGTMSEIFGSYATAAASATFTLSAHEKHSEDVAALRGARLVTAQEVPAGARWSQQRLTSLVSTDRISARGLYQSRSDFVPTFAITFAANTTPRMPNVDNAVRRRLLILECPFIPPRPDALLPEKLRSEGAAILRWALDGARAWYRGGLWVPGCIRQASATYFDAEDLTRAFLAERLEEGARFAVTHGDLRDEFASWAALHGRRDDARAHDIGAALRSLGFEVAKDELGIRGRGLKGVRIRTEEPFA